MVEGETFPRVESDFTELKNVKVVFCASIFMYIPRTSVIRSQELQQIVLVSFSKQFNRQFI